MVFVLIVTTLIIILIVAFTICFIYCLIYFSKKSKYNQRKSSHDNKKRLPYVADPGCYYNQFGIDEFPNPNSHQNDNSHHHHHGCPIEDHLLVVPADNHLNFDAQD